MARFYFVLLFAIIFTKSAMCIENQLLWKISGNGLKKPSFHFGTYHIFPSEFLDSVYMFQHVFDNVEMIIVETYVDNKSRQSTFKKFRDSLFLTTNNLKYKDLYNESELQKVDSFFMSYLKCKSEKVNIRPSVATIIITGMIGIENNHNSKPQLLDGYIINTGKQAGKSIYGLETTEEQLNTIYWSSNDINGDAKVLLELIKHKTDVVERQLKLLKAYREQNLSEMEAFISDNLLGSIDTTNKLLKNRNLKWIPQIDKIIKTKHSLIVVGALHLVGEFGLINQLRKLGYVVKPINE